MRNLLYFTVLTCVYAMYCVDENMHIKESFTFNGIVCGTYKQTINKTGWDELFIETSKTGQYNAVTQAYAAGLLEGNLTATSIRAGIQTFKQTFKVDKNTLTFIWNNYQWIITQIRKYQDVSDYWQRVSTMILQLLGMAKGANVSAHDLYLLNMQGDLGDLMNGKNGYTHCSALLKYLGDELHVAHTTWYYYSSMYRIYKTMDLSFVNSTQAFSSYPGLIVSLDDFYIVKGRSNNSGLVVTETTNDIFNTSLYSNLSIATMPYLFRVTMANRYATDGTTWISLFSEYNSGTYNNQWLISEMSGSNSRIYILEQIPGYIETADITDIVKANTYWASYNIPYFPYIYNVSGYLQMYQKHGVEYSYTNCSRANIFRAKHKFIRNMEDMKYSCNTTIIRMIHSPIIILRLLSHPVMIF